TGGLRGIMGLGTNRMNRYTVGMATQGLANYLLKSLPAQEIRIAIAYDCRLNNTVFADVTADVFSANGIHVYLFDALRPTPELSFAIRHLGCQSGIVITASHNPREYNGYKVYWNDGGQLVPPHDKNVIREVEAVGNPQHVRFDRNAGLIHTIGEDVDTVYIAALLRQSLSPEAIARQKDLRIVYTPIHGTGVKLVPMALKAFGFTNIISVPEQEVVSGEFPTVHSPNPEESAALKLALEKAEATGADLVMATDPDADRVGIAVRDTSGKMVLLNGNQTASLLIYYLLSQWKAQGRIDGRQFIAKTIVTTDLLSDIASAHEVPTEEVLTGFKYIAEIIRENEGKRTFIGGGEESYGYLIGDYVRDKDAVISCCMVAETAAWAREHGLSLYELLLDIYRRYGLYVESLLSITRKGKKGAEEIQEMLRTYRQDPPRMLAGETVVRVVDYLDRTDRNLVDGSVRPIALPSSNVLQFFTLEGSKITVRPSGTEPKIKFYFAVKATPELSSAPEKTLPMMEARIVALKQAFGA
ncbi:MAG TPA: phospho-sugar mutase, partial [Bacteroidales bacterium]|nr:phospho-sugar mutase [Bacteroidales bacterium]